MSRIHRRQRVVEHDYPRTGDDRPSQGEALALATRKRETAITDGATKPTCTGGPRCRQLPPR